MMIGSVEDHWFRLSKHVLVEPGLAILGDAVEPTF